MNLLGLLADLGPQADLREIRVLDTGYRYELPRYDQTLTPVAESAIEFVVRKRPIYEIEVGGRLPGVGQPDVEMLRHLNQYHDDQKTLRENNSFSPPFNNIKSL